MTVPGLDERRLTLVLTELARTDSAAELAECLDHGVDVDHQDEDGNSLLMLAAYHGCTATVTMLLARGADPDLCNGRDQCALSGALFKGERTVVDLLRAAGASLDVGTPTAREAAALFGQPI